jgi:1-acyl-sn-glycerol-3-phosphate acyltransferase
MWSAYFVKREGEGEEKREKKKRRKRRRGFILFISSHVSSPWDLLLPSTSKDS